LRVDGYGGVAHGNLSGWGGLGWSSDVIQESTTNQHKKHKCPAQ
jgi:hypothetical protein